MKTRRLKLEWTELEEAFTNQNDEWVYFLDLVTGLVKLEGEGVVDTFDDDDDFDTRAPVAVLSRRNDPTRAYVEIPDTAAKLIWLKSFLEEEEVDAAVKAQLAEVMVGDNPASKIRALLNKNSELRDAWYLYRADHIRARIDTWL